MLGTVGGATYGVAKKTNIVAVKVLGEDGSGSISGIIDGLQYALNRFNGNGRRKAVINMSLGSPGTSPLLSLVTEDCIDAGMHVVVAAGNEFDDACAYTPASVERAITVAANKTQK